MSDVNIKESRYRITYTPDGGEEVLLLDCEDEVNAEPMLEGGPQVATHALIDRAWAHHESTGAADVTLRFDVHRRAPSPAAAQALGLRMWRYLMTHPQGTLRLQTAFVHRKSGAMIDWKMRASVSSVSHEDLDIDTSPYPQAASCHLSYEFKVTLPETDDFDV